MIDKEAAFHELMDRMENNTCPICDMVEYRYNETVDRFFYENVNTPHLRYKIEKANGFCTYHAQKLSERNDPLTHAILYHDFLQIVMVQRKIKHLYIKKEELVTMLQTFIQAVKEKNISYFNTFAMMINSSISKNKDLKTKFLQIVNLVNDIVGR